MATKKSKNNTYKFLFFLTLIILISFVITVYIKCPETFNFSKENNSKTISSELTKNTWVSNIDGAMLNFKAENTFEIDIPSVESSAKIAGKYIIEEDNISFTFDPESDVCNKEPGKYTYKITAEKLEFKVVSDKCESRKYQWTAGWFKL